MSLLRNTLTVGGATLASRVLGFARDTLIAAALGTGFAADAFIVAFRLPNLFRRLFAEGAFAAAFVPLRVRLAREAGEGAAGRFAGEALAVLVCAVAVVTAAAVAAAPVLVDLLAPGFAEDPAKRDLAVLLARVCLPYLPAITAVALISGLMTADRRYLVPALAPVLLNLVLIAALLATLAADLMRPAAAGTLLAVAVVVGGLAQLLLLVVAARRAGLAPPLLRPRLSPEVMRLLRLGLPGVLSGALAEINVVIGTVVASSTAGAVSWLYFADRLHQLPLGVVGIAIGQVLLPEIAHRIAAGDEAAGREVQNRALEFALALALPAALALVLLAEPIVLVLFERGAFTATDRIAAAEALAIFAAGLPAFVLGRVFAPAFFAREDTRTPMAVAAVAVAVNVAAALSLEPVVGWIAVAIATTLAGWVSAAGLFALLVKRGHWCGDADLARRLPRLALAAVAMAAVVFAAEHLLAGVFDPHRPLLVTGGALAGLVVLGLAVYAGLVLALGVVDPARLRALVAARRDRPDPEVPCSRPEDAA